MDGYVRHERSDQQHVMKLQTTGRTGLYLSGKIRLPPPVDCLLLTLARPARPRVGQTVTRLTLVAAAPVCLVLVVAKEDFEAVAEMPRTLMLTQSFVYAEAEWQ